MATGVSTAAGASLWIGTTALTGSTDTFTKVGEVVTIPEMGRVYAEVKYQPLSSRGVQKFKGSYDDGGVTLSIGKDLSDAGQAALVVAMDVDADYNFKIIDNDAVPAASATGVTIAAATLAAPVQNALATATTGGSLTATTYYYKVTALNANGETVGSNEQSILTTGTTSSNTVTWAAVPGVTGYRVYRGTAAGAESTYYALGNVLTFTDTGAAGTAGTVPVTNSATTTIIVTDNAHGLPANTGIVFPVGTTGLPTSTVAGTTYYVLAPTMNSYNLAATPGGAAINITGTASGTYTRTTVPVGTTMVFKAKVMSHTTIRGGVDSVIMSNVLLGIKSGTIVETVHLP